MVIESKEEVYSWFKDLSGAHRIEVLSALLTSCIPLEYRFFASLIESLARRDYCSLLDDEHLANSASDMEALCTSDWLADLPKRPQPVDLQNGIVPPDRRSVAPDLAPKPLAPEQSVSEPVSAPVSFSAPKPAVINLRQRVVVMICLLNSTNRLCATIIFKAIQKHFSVSNLQQYLEVHAKDREKEKLMVRPDRLVVDEITLVFTLALCHPAFSYEQENLLSYQVSCCHTDALSDPCVTAAENSERLSEFMGNVRTPAHLLPSSFPVCAHVLPSPTLLSYHRICSRT